MSEQNLLQGYDKFISLHTIWINKINRVVLPNTLVFKPRMIRTPESAMHTYIMRCLCSTFKASPFPDASPDCSESVLPKFMMLTPSLEFVLVQGW